MEQEVDQLEEEQIAAPEVDGEDDRGDENDDGRADDFVLARPGHLLHLHVGVAEEVARGEPPLFRSGDDRVVVLVRFPLFSADSGQTNVRSRSLTTLSLSFWQAKRDSNPQPAVLETAALPIELLA